MAHGDRTSAYPIWAGVLNEMQRSGVFHGNVYETAWFEQRLFCRRDTIEFDSAITDIRKELEKDGFHLSQYGRGGDRFVIMAPESNLDRMLAYQRDAIETFGRAVVLGANTRLDLLSQSQRRRHEAISERIATRAALIGRRKIN